MKKTYKEIYDLYLQHKKCEDRYSKQEEGVFNLFDDITEETGRRFEEYLASNPDRVHLRINSWGGDVKTGLAIYNRLKTVKQIKTENIGFAASMAADLMLTGHERVSHSMSMMLFHRTQSMAYGDQDDILKQYENMKRIDDMFMRELYLPKFNMSEEEITALLKEDRYMDANEALKINAVEKLIDNDNQETTFVASVKLKGGVDEAIEQVKKLEEISLTLQPKTDMLLTKAENEMLDYITKGER